MEAVDLAPFCQRLPKVELHAHLNGSLSEKTLEKLCRASGNKEFEPKDYVSNNHSINDCFKLFNIAHAVTENTEAVACATRDVISEFAADGVVYLELRTTPRLVERVMTKAQYINAVVQAILDRDSYLPSGTSLTVKLLLSINRKEGPDCGKDTIEEAIRAHHIYPDVVVGVDLSGNPGLGDLAQDYLHLLNKARDAGLKVALHCAEIPNESEVEEILKFRADRLGHGTCIHPAYQGSQKLWDMLLESKIPIEVCLTSNVKCQTVKNYQNHHLKHLFLAGHPIAISTDDKGVFATTLSMEYEIAARYFNLEKQDLCDLVKMSIDAAFTTKSHKEKMMLILDDFKLREGLLSERNFPACQSVRNASG